MGITKAVELAEFIEINVSEEAKRDEVRLAIENLIELVKLAIKQAKSLYN